MKREPFTKADAECHHHRCWSVAHLSVTQVPSLCIGIILLATRKPSCCPVQRDSQIFLGVIKIIHGRKTHELLSSNVLE